MTDSESNTDIQDPNNSQESKANTETTIEINSKSYALSGKSELDYRTLCCAVKHIKTFSINYRSESENMEIFDIAIALQNTFLDVILNRNFDDETYNRLYEIADYIINTKTDKIVMHEFLTFAIAVDSIFNYHKLTHLIAKRLRNQNF